MSQPNDPWGHSQPNQPPQPYSFPQAGYGQPSNVRQPNQPYPQQPPSQPELKPLPANWQKPIQPQWNPTGVYGGVPDPPKAVKPWPWWATMILVFVVFGGIGFYSFYINKPNSTTNGQQVIATAGPTQKVAQIAATVAPTSKIGRVGETIALNGYTITINKVEKSENFDPSSDYGKAKEGKIFLAVDVTVGSNKPKDVSSNALFSGLKDSDGFKYDQPFSGYRKPLLPGENDIPTGDKVRGWVTFEVPKTAKGFIFEYGQMFESEKIRIALE